MAWVDRCIDHLILGDSINLTGLAGSGRSLALTKIIEQLDKSDWNLLQLSSAELRDMSRRDIESRLDSLSVTEKFPVLVIDDYGELIFSPQRRWIDSMLYARITSHTDVDHERLRCVVVTRPRDTRMITPDGSNLLEHAQSVTPEMDNGTQQLAERFGCDDVDGLLRLTGGNAHLRNVEGDTPQERRRNARSAAEQWLPTWIGQLNEEHQRRLADILERASPARWSSQEADPILAPLVVPLQMGEALRCHLLESIERQDVLSLLMGQPWPYGDVTTAVRRFSARCGDDQAPLWVDNFLSDLTGSGWNRLVDFLVSLADILGPDCHIKILSRNWVHGKGLIAPRDIKSALRGAGLPPSPTPRIDWRIYDRKVLRGDLHERQLIVRAQNAVFKLPPANHILGIGSTPSVNEHDALIAVATSKSALEAWENAQIVL